MAALINLMTNTNTTCARTNFINTGSHKPSIIFHRLPINNSSEEESSYLEPLSSSPSFDFKSYMHQKVTSVNIALDKAVPLKQPIEIIKPMRYSLICNGGKRVRPILLIAACELFGGHEQTAMPAACAMEMIHAMSLMHDDLPIMDNDDFRREKPSCHMVFGNASALLGGDALLSHAFDHLVKAYSKLGFISPQNLVRVIGELAQGSGPEGLMGGQLLDVLSTSEKASEIDLDYMESLQMGKAGALIEKSVVIGAILGGANHEDVERLRKFARCMGHFFGFMDDILDVEKDGLYDKATYPKVLGMEKTIDFAKELRREALEMIAGFGYDQEKTAPFSALIDFIAYGFGLWER